MDEDLQLVLPDIEDIPEDDRAEPLDAEIFHEASVEEVEEAFNED